MNKEDLKTGKKLQSRIEEIEKEINRLDNKEKTNRIEISVVDHGLVYVRKNDLFTNKANHDLVFLNQLYRDNVLKTLENCKSDLEKEFELLGNNIDNDTKTELNGRNS